MMAILKILNKLRLIHLEEAKVSLTECKLAMQSNLNETGDTSDDYDYYGNIRQNLVKILIRVNPY